MRQQHSAIESKAAAALRKKESSHSFQFIMADSEEVMEYYYRGKIQELEQSLAQLTILDNAREIAFLCKEIMRTKATLQKIIMKKEARFAVHTSVK